MGMDNILFGLKLGCVLVYLDNINVFSRTFAEHLNDLEDVFKQLINNNLKLKPKKCSFFKSELKYLGFVLTKEGLHPHPAKIEAIQLMKPPSCIRDIQVFLGMIDTIVALFKISC